MPLHRIVLADDPVAADTVCAELMGFDPRRLRHLVRAATVLGRFAEPEHLTEWTPYERPFAVLPAFARLLASPSAFSTGART